MRAMVRWSFNMKIIITIKKTKGYEASKEIISLYDDINDLCSNYDIVEDTDMQ